MVTTRLCGAPNDLLFRRPPLPRRHLPVLLLHLFHVPSVSPRDVFAPVPVALYLSDGTYETSN